MSKIFKKETDLCAAFLAEVARRNKDWIAYAETEGFDIVLARKTDGAQIGIEAKLSLNATVVCQALDGAKGWSAGVRGPDYRAVLVPADATRGLAPVCGALGLTVIGCHEQREPRAIGPVFTPDLPAEKHEWSARGWHEWLPVERLRLPEYVPDVAAGASAPVALTHWKIQAIKLAILLEERAITRADFKALGVSPTRWTDPFTRWLVKGDGGYVAGPNLPRFKEMHPVAWEQIKADREKWAPKGKQAALL